MTEQKIFISHRSTDKDIADMLLDFFAATGLPKDCVFCSSLPGNDVEQKISEEIKRAILDSVVNIVILSNDYYQSAYCLNEEGVIWFRDTPVIVISMPEINSSKMLGFLGNEYKLRYLDNESDIAAIYDQVGKTFEVIPTSATSLTYAISKLKTRYVQYIEVRGSATAQLNIQTSAEYGEVTTDDERVILYYLLLKKIRKVNNKDIEKWLTDNEIYDINVSNAFDLLAAAGWGILVAGEAATVFEIEISHFRGLSKISEDISNPLKETAMQHRRLSKDWFIAMWKTEQFDESDLLFIAYIRDENVFTYGNRWMANGQIEHIKEWESKHSLLESLSKDYEKCLNKFVENKFVYESSWTSYGNPREYTLHKSIKSYFSSNDFPYAEELAANKEKYYFELPF